MRGRVAEGGGGGGHFQHKIEWEVSGAEGDSWESEEGLRTIALLNLPNKRRLSLWGVVTDFN